MTKTLPDNRVFADLTNLSPKDADRTRRLIFKLRNPNKRTDRFLKLLDSGQLSARQLCDLI